MVPALLTLSYAPFKAEVECPRSHTCCGFARFRPYILVQICRLKLRTTSESSSTSTDTPAVSAAPPTTAPVVVTKTAVTLADHLDLRNLPLATTPGGKNFALKCLHPAESEIKVNRGPGGSLPSVGMNFDFIKTIPVPLNTVNCYIVQTANPLVPLMLDFLDSQGTSVGRAAYTNTAFGLSGYKTAWSSYGGLIPTTVNNYLEWVDDYRVTAQSLTLDYIAPMVADQGTITAAQFTHKPVTQSPASCTFRDSQGTPPYAMQSYNSVADTWFYEPMPDPQTLLMGTSAYTAKLREGVYQPLKLTKFKWVNARDRFVPLNSRSAVTGMIVREAVPSVPGSIAAVFPYMISDTPLATDAPLVKPSCHTVGLVHISGMGVTSTNNVSLRIRFRQCIEMHVTPGSLWSPMTEAPYPPDRLAYEMVAEIFGRMKDGYPASYNDLGKLKDTIGKLGNELIQYVDPVLDVLGMVPGVGSVASGLKTAMKVGKGVAGVVSAVKQRKKQRVSAQPATGEKAGDQPTSNTAAAAAARAQQKKGGRSKGQKR